MKLKREVNVVQRYIHNTDGVSLDPHERGDWVKFEDYNALQSELENILSSVREAVEYQKNCKPELMHEHIWQAYRKAKRLV